MGERVAVRALAFADRRATNLSLTETGWSLDLMLLLEIYLPGLSVIMQ